MKDANQSQATRAGNWVDVVEVGTRDGLQIESRIIPAARKIEILNKMIASGMREIEVTSFVSPKAVPQLADAAEVLAGIERRAGTYLSALVPNVKGAERAAATGVDAGMLFISVSETHNRKNLNRSIDDSIAGFAPVVEVLRAAGKDVMGGTAVAFGCPFEGEIDQSNLLRIVHAYFDLGIDHITLGDTTGMATPNNVRQTVRLLRQHFPGIKLNLHLHNTRGVGLANVVVGLEEGVRRFDSSCGGLGGCPFAAGATGNICTEDLLYLLAESGYETGIDLGGAIDVALMMEQSLEKRLPGQMLRAGPRLKLHSADAVPTAAG